MSKEAAKGSGDQQGKSKNKNENSADSRGEQFPGYPSYPPEDDIYSKETEESDLDPDNPGQLKAPNEPPDAPNEKNELNDFAGSDLDVPGSEADDAQEAIGSEDEENNYYSLGGDDKEGLEEDRQTD